ncbi:MAG TPA: hypothetical protein DGG95_12945 [Cytophagales bacterium]|jgi:hypothetical protein|nr:hypothetical protein [Cytophagales bacterium]
MISSFEYVTVLISIVLGLGITQVLTGIAKLIQKRNKVIIYWPHLLWVTFILFLHIQEWWVMYELKSFIPWRLPVFLFIMLYPINLYVMAKVIFPESMRGQKIDMKKFYFENYKGFFALLISSASLSLAYNISILKYSLSEQVLQLLIIVCFSFILFKNYSNEVLHKGIALIVIVIMCGAIVVEWNTWLIN